MRLRTIKRNYKNLQSRFLLVCLMLLSSPVFNLLFAQPGGGGPGGGDPPDPPCWQPECIPVDGGIGFLVLAGVAIGGRKLYRSMK